jgi:hypothetical protein
MCETMQSSHRLRPVMTLVRALLAPTASGDDAGERFCAPLPPSPPRFRGIALKTLDEFQYYFHKSEGFFYSSGFVYSLEKKFVVSGSKHDRLFIKNEK